MPERRHIKVLLIEDNPGDVRLIWEILSEIRNSPFYLNVVDTLFRGLKEIENNPPDVILLDLSLPDSNGIYTLNRVRDKAPQIPIVVITGFDDELTAIQSLKEGAQDYLVKGRTEPDLLKRALLYAIERNRLLIEIEKRDKIKRDFISKVLHEILIPTGIIRSTMWMCDKKESISKEEAKRVMEIVINNTTKIFNFLDDIINVSELETGKFSIIKKKVNLNEIIEKNIKDIYSIAEEKLINIVNQINKEIEINVDPIRFSQVITKLLLNAIKYSEKNKNIYIGFKDLNDKIEIFIKDEGQGFKKEELELYNKFFSNKNDINDKNIGLGFRIIKEIINSHNGNIYIESDREGKGSTFYIILPK